MAKVIIVGAGMGGLALGLRLAHRGVKVTILEKNDFVGGRCHRLEVGGCQFDGGPTLLMMLEPFRALFNSIGFDFDAEFDIQLCNPCNRVFFPNGSTIDALADRASMTAQILEKCGASDAASYGAFLDELKLIYEASIPHFVRKNYDSVLGVLRPKAVQLALNHRLLGNLKRDVHRRFRDPRLQVLFCLQTMYLGLSPAQAPRVYEVLTYMEYGEGIFYPRGGLNTIPRRMAELAQARGAEIQLNSTVTQITGKSVTLATGELLTGDAVICNADLPYAEKSITRSAGREGQNRKYRYSCSAMALYIAYQGELPGFAHHNIVISNDFEGNLKAIFEQKQVPTDPSFYVAISKGSDPSVAPDGLLNLFVLIPCPNLTHSWNESEQEQLISTVFKKLSTKFGFSRDKVTAMRVRSPHDWESDFNLDLGATFGLSHDLFQSICFRSSNKSKVHPGLYYVGASTVPGNGLPMTLISAELAEQRLLKDGVIR